MRQDASEDVGEYNKNKIIVLSIGPGTVRQQQTRIIHIPNQEKNSACV